MDTISFIVLDKLMELNWFASNFACRKAILMYFGEDTSHLAMRDDCCDNCAKELSNWKLTDLYVGIDDQGQYDFTRDANNCMKMCNVPATRQNIIDLLDGKKDKSLALLPHYGIGKDRQHYYWRALIDQLMYNDYIDFVCGQPDLTLSTTGENWRNDDDRNKMLKTKPAGAIYKFIGRKPSTPFSYTDPTEEDEEYS